MDKLNLTAKEIAELQNLITIEEFKTNFNKTEIERICSMEFSDELEKPLYLKMAKFLENYLQSNAKENLKIRVSHVGSIEVLEKVELFEHIEALQNVKTIYSESFYQVPYHYVMGKAVPRRQLEEFLQQYKNAHPTNKNLLYKIMKEI